MQKVLIVDDNKAIASSYMYLLSDSIQGIEILIARDESEALEAINNNVIDVIITDLVMETDQSGVSLLKAAKGKDPLTMVIIFTAYEIKLDREKVYEIGAYDCITKGSVENDNGNELLYKTRNAIKYCKTLRSLVKSESEKTLEYYRPFFDPIIFERIQKTPEILLPRNKMVTVVFWDIRGFSLLSQTFKSRPTLIAGFLKEYLEAASKIIFNNLGVLDKFIGDGVMAIFGAFDENDGNDIGHQGNNDAIAAVNAALELRKEFGTIYMKWKQVWEKEEAADIDIGLGCGMHTGEALVGKLGTEYRNHFTAIGAHVNLAARIEKSSEKSQVRISQTTKNRVENKYNLEHIATLENIKNIHGTYKIYSIVN